MVIETQHFGASCFEKAWTDALLERCVEEHHASWMSIHGDPRRVLSKSSNAVSRINRRLGYRFQFEHETSYRRIDGSKHDCDNRFVIFIYLRALGTSSMLDLAKF